MKRGLLKEQILEALRIDEKSRNSDIRLTQVVWYKFYNRYLFDNYNGDMSIAFKDLNNVPREDHIARIRRVIQNDEHKYVPTDRSVALKRGFDNVNEWRSWLGYSSGETL